MLPFLSERRKNMSKEIVKITVDRAEGLHSECFKTEHSTVEDANKRLGDISMTAPRTGGYDKTDVEIFFSDGFSVKSRHDVKYLDTDGDVIGHAVRFISFVAFNQKATYLTEDVRKEAKDALQRINANI
jgi:hypothetical protein